VILNEGSMFHQNISTIYQTARSHVQEYAQPQKHQIHRNITELDRKANVRVTRRDLAVKLDILIEYIHIR
jgi:hypothetical protein